MFLKGEGVKQNYTTVAYWIEQAAQQDHTDAQCCMGMLYKEGLGMALLHITLTRIAEGTLISHNVCEHNYATTSLGIVKDLDKPLYWLSAALKGSEKAKPILYSMGKNGFLSKSSSCSVN